MKLLTKAKSLLLKLGLLIEGKDGFDAIPSIVTNLSAHIDLIYFGLFDFASSQNVEPDWDNEELSALLQNVVREATQQHIKVGTIARSRKDLERLENMGVTYVVYLNDLGIIRDAIRGF